MLLSDDEPIKSSKITSIGCPVTLDLILGWGYLAVCTAGFMAIRQYILPDIWLFGSSPSKFADISSAMDTDRFVATL